MRILIHVSAIFSYPFANRLGVLINCLAN